MCNSRGSSASLGGFLLLLLLQLTGSRAASILHHSHDSSAISHQSFVRLPTQHIIGALATPPASELSREKLPLSLPVPLELGSHALATPTVRIINTGPAELRREPHPLPLPLQLNAHTPAELTYAAHPVVHQMLPQIKPVRNLSYAELRPTPRREGEERRHNYVVYTQ